MWKGNFQDGVMMQNNPIRVLDLRDSPWLDGPGRTILQCAEDIDKDGFQIIIGAFNSGLKNGTEYEREAQMKGLRVIRIKERSQIDFRPIKQVISLVKKLKIDILHTHDFRSNLIGTIAAKLMGKPIVITVHGWISNDFKGRLKSSIDKVIVRHSNFVIAVSKKTLESIGNPNSFMGYRIMPNALKLHNYQPLRPFGSLKQELGVGENEIIIATIGRLSPEKGQRLFIDAAQSIVKNYNNMRFLIIGTGPDRSMLEKLVKDKGISKYIIFTGYRDDMQTAYNNIDLVVQSSWTEGMPNVILEAMLMQVPVIATNVGGTGQIVSNGRNGTLIKPGDLKALISNMLHFIRQPKRFSQMAMTGRKDIQTHFNHADRVKALQKIYTDVLSSFEKNQHRSKILSSILFNA